MNPKAVYLYPAGDCASSGACAGVPEYTVQSFQFLSLHPRIIVFPNFINNAKATRFIKLAEARMIQSSLALRKGETVEGKKGLSPQNNMHTNQHSYTRQSGCIYKWGIFC